MIFFKWHYIYFKNNSESLAVKQISDRSHLNIRIDATVVHTYCSSGLTKSGQTSLWLSHSSWDFHKQIKMFFDVLLQLQPIVRWWSKKESTPTPAERGHICDTQRKEAKGKTINKVELFLKGNTLDCSKQSNLIPESGTASQQPVNAAELVTILKEYESEKNLYLIFVFIYLFHKAPI